MSPPLARNLEGRWGGDYCLVSRVPFLGLKSSTNRQGGVVRGVRRWSVLSGALGLLGALILGCATSLASIRAENQERLRELRVGMTKEEVLRVMGTKTRSGGAPLQLAGKDKIPNPYRTEAYQADGSAFEILFYYTDKKASDGAITNDELTPLVLRDGELDGWGWSYWESAAVKYNIRVSR